MSVFKFIGCILLVISCMIGGGILALPIIVYEFGLTISYLIMTFAYIIMLSSGLLVLEICLKLPAYKNNYGSIAEHSFGKIGRYVVMIIAAIALYTVITAYISASPAIFTNTFLSNIQVPHQDLILSFVFTAILGSIVVCGIKYADFLNRFIMGFKLIVLISVVILLLWKIPTVSGFDFRSFDSFSEGFTIILFVFSYQAVIPSLANYIGKDNAVYTRRVIIIGVTATFIITMLWATIIVSVIQPYATEIGSQLTLDELLKILGQYDFGNITNLFLKAFFNITLISSFIALSIAFIDIWVDMLKLDYKFSNRIIGGLIVYIPCWLVANFSTNIFIAASAISGYCGLFGALLLPSIISYKQYKREEIQFIPGKLVRAAMIVISVLVLVIIALKV